MELQTPTAREVLEAVKQDPSLPRDGMVVIEEIVNDTPSEPVDFDSSIFNKVNNGYGKDLNKHMNAKLLVETLKNVPGVKEVQTRKGLHGKVTVRAVFELENQHGHFNRFAIGSSKDPVEAVRTCGLNAVRIAKKEGLIKAA